VPTSVLLAVLAAAGLLALAPALVRRYDATERLVAERARSSARVLNRTRRRRTVPMPGRPLHVPLPVGEINREGVRPAVGRSVWLHVDRGTPATAPPTEAPPSADIAPVDAAPAAAPPPLSVRRVPSAADSRAGARPAAVRKAQATLGARRSTTPAGPRSAQARGGLAARGSAGARGAVARGVVARGAVARGGAAGRGDQAARRTASVRRQRPKPRRPVRNRAIYRRRRVFAGLIVLNVIELIGVTTVSTGFWTGFAVTLLLLGAYIVHLRNSAISEARTRRLRARHAARIALAQAEIRMEHERRLAARREALRRAAATRANAQREAQRLSQRYVDHDPERGARVRGRSYETGKNYDDRAAGF
jgi:hypothetical protein